MLYNGMSPHEYAKHSKGEFMLSAITEGPRKKTRRCNAAWILELTKTVDRALLRPRYRCRAIRRGPFQTTAGTQRSSKYTHYGSHLVPQGAFSTKSRSDGKLSCSHPRARSQEGGATSSSRERTRSQAARRKQADRSRPQEEGRSGRHAKTVRCRRHELASGKCCMS